MYADLRGRVLYIDGAGLSLATWGTLATAWVPHVGHSSYSMGLDLMGFRIHVTRATTLHK
jgi:hypothetical protein